MLITAKLSKVIVVLSVTCVPSWHASAYAQGISPTPVESQPEQSSDPGSPPRSPGPWEGDPDGSGDSGGGYGGSASTPLPDGDGGLLGRRDSEPILL